MARIATDRYRAGASGEPLIVARSMAAAAEGSELFLSYGAHHPDFVFGVHYGFVPKPQQPASACTQLCFDACDLGLGAAAVRTAFARLERGEVDSTADDWTEDAIRKRPTLALASLLANVPCSPLKFIISSANLASVGSPPVATGSDGTDAGTAGGTTGDTAEAAAAAAPADVAQAAGVDEPEQKGGGLGLPLLQACARLCALQEDGSGASEARQAATAIVDVLLSGSIGPENDIDAAVLVTTAARSQRDRLLARTAAECGGGEGASAPGVRGECVALADAMRDSEMAVLERLCSGDEAGLLFELSGWAGAAEVLLED